MKNALLAALACQAVGDALGNKFEFQRSIKTAEVLKHIRAQSRVGITDDTQMAYFGLRAMERHLVHGEDTKKALLIEYQNWYDTQTVGCSEVPDCFNASRAPGTATMSSLRELKERGTRAQNTARGCGSVMKLLPFVCLPYQYGQRFRIAMESSSVTHDHAENLDAVSQYMAFADLLMNEGPSAALAIPHSIRSAASIRALGAGFYAKECVEMALWAVAQAGSFEELLMLAICHDGDSDSVAAVAGSLWGLMARELPEPRLLHRVIEWPHLEAQVVSFLTAARTR
jgi:ADP-ribosylglycohydrolase